MEYLKVKFVPADPELPAEIKEVPNDPSVFKILVDGWIEIVKTAHMRDMNICMIVNEDGIAQGKALNRRAMELSQYPGNIVGDVVFVGWNYHPDADWFDYPDAIDLTNA